MGPHGSEHALREALQQYSFYHVIPLTDHLQTPGIARYQPIQEMVLDALRGIDLRDTRVLDVGCRDGLFAFAAERQGAREVIGIDNDLSPALVEFLIPYFGSRVQAYEMNLYAATPERFGQFDVVIFAGVLYHLRYPFWALKRIGDLLRPGGRLLLETAYLVDDGRHAILFCPVGAESPYEPTSCSFFNLKGLTDTLTGLGWTVETVTRLRPPGRRFELRQRVRVLLGRGRSMLVDRAALTCRWTPERVDPTLARYWNGTHRIHTTMFLPPEADRSGPGEGAPRAQR